MAVHKSSMMKKRAVRRKASKTKLNPAMIKHAKKHAITRHKKKLPKAPNVF